MHFSFRGRLIALALLFLVLAAGMFFGARPAWREIADLRRRFTEVQLESFRIADHLDASVRRLDAALLAFEASGQAADRQWFEEESERLGGWLTEQRLNLRRPGESKILDEIDAGFQRYLAGARSAVAEVTPNAENRALVNRLARVEQDSEHVLALGHQLAEAHREAISQFLAETQSSLTLLQRVIAGGAVALFTLGGLGMIDVFREIKRRSVQAQQQRLAALGLLAAGVAHEIRNPLTAIKARLYTQQKALEKNSSAHADAVLIGEEITRLERIVRDFLEFARPPEPERVAVAPRELLEEVRALLAPELKNSAIQLAVDGAVETRAAADPQQLKQVLINLIRNAAESIGEHGRVTLRAHERRSPSGAPAVVLEVEDTGRGIPAHVQPRLFDPFFTTKPTGTGLGLSIAARIVENHGGSISFRSSPDEGTTFSILLPAATS